MYFKSKARGPANDLIPVKVPSPIFLVCEEAVLFTGQHSIGKTLLSYKSPRSCASPTPSQIMWAWGKVWQETVSKSWSISS